MVAINSAIEVDLTGQVCADSIGPKLYSGVVVNLTSYTVPQDQKEGYHHRPTSTTTMRDGKVISRIVTMLKQGAGVVTSRNHVRYIVTEYGVADLYGKSIRKRAEALINIAHPDFRETMKREATELRYL